jgi:predicted metal-binding membrane protein
MSDPLTMLETVLRRDRAIVAVGLVGIVVLAWLYLFHLARTMAVEIAEMERHAVMGMAMPQMYGWGVGDIALLFIMWTVMMVAMMVPSAAPMILAFSMIHRRRGERQRPSIPVGAFLAGYLVVWALYAAVATLAQSGLHAAALLSPSMATSSPVLGGVLFIAAGVFQWTPLKRVCLANCRSPLAFLLTRWREGASGAFTMGIHHGMYCVGCCWMLMGLLFVTGVMNLAWVAAVAIAVLVEKLVPRGERIGRLAGIGLVVAGLLMLGSAWWRITMPAGG